jgi:1A family penicillin-binding protein
MSAPVTQAPAPPDPRVAAQETAAAAKLLASQTGRLARTLAASSAGRVRGWSTGAASWLATRRAARVQADEEAARTRPPQATFRERLRRVPNPFRGFRWRYLFAIPVLAFVLLLGFLAYNLATLPLNGGQQVDPTQSALTIESDRGEPFATRGVFKGDRVTTAELPPHIAQAIVAIEDRRFYEHSGVDLRGILRAAWRNTGGAREGGSTITQQLARLMFLSQERSIRRKTQEAMIAVWLETQLSKDEILVRYLNTAFFGAGAYGVDAAAKRYFGKRAKDATLAEAAMLAGLVRAPSQLAPTRNFGGAKERADLVLQTMVETGAITAKQAEEAQGQTIALRTPPETPPGANYFVDMVAGDIRRLLGSTSGDLTLRTTLNLELQRLAEGVIERRLEADGAKRDVSQAALVALRPDGAILAVVGGRDYEGSQFNRATQAKRQPGSLFKLFVYEAALQKGLTPQSVLVDRPTTIGDWEPQNASGRFRGAVDLRTAFAQSINTVAAQLADDVGIPAVIETAKRMGVSSPLPSVPSLALGSAEVTLMEMTRAYATVASGTTALEPYGIRSIAGSGTGSLYARPGAGADAAGPASNTRAAMLDLLQAVVSDGTGKAARVPNVAVAGKTGTTQDHRDAWFIGFTPNLIVGVWVGNDDNSPMKTVTGGELPAAIWRDFVSRAVQLGDKRTPVVATSASPPPGRPAAVPPPPPAPPPQDPRRASAVQGPAEVVDTGTLAVRGRLARLQGVEGESGRLARQLARFLRGREVVCDAGQSSDVQRCRVDGSDLSELILAAGGARASPDAPPELLAAEEQARSARLGLWRRER